MAFSDELKLWRGKRAQKEVCDLFEVPLVTYQKWEQGVNEPKDIVKSEVRWRMAADSCGLSLLQYRARYLLVIKQVVSEIKPNGHSKTYA